MYDCRSGALLGPGEAAKVPGEPGWDSRNVQHPNFWAQNFFALHRLGSDISGTFTHQSDMKTQASSSPCLFEHLLLGCDELLLMGGYGIESCDSTAKVPKKTVWYQNQLSMLYIPCILGMDVLPLFHYFPVEHGIVICTSVHRS